MKLIVTFRNYANAFKNQDKICAVVTVKFSLLSKILKSEAQEEAILCAVLYGRERWPLVESTQDGKICAENDDQDV